MVKTTGYIHNLTYAGEGLLGAVSGNAGQLYSGAFDKFNSPEYFLELTTPADFPSAVFGITGNASSEIVGGADWAGIVLTDNDTTVGMMCVLLYLLVSFLPTVEHTHTESNARGSCVTARAGYTVSSVSDTTMKRGPRSALWANRARCFAPMAVRGRIL